MSVTLRPGRADDARRCGAICYEAFRTIAQHHNFPPDFPSPEAATEVVAGLLAHPRFHGVVAELDGRVVGSNFLDERSSIAGVGPITVDPAVQNRSIGRRLMEHVLERAARRPFPGVRLVQAAYHNRSLSLYTRLGFTAREPLSLVQGATPPVRVTGYDVREATGRDLEDGNRVCALVHGHDRGGDLRDAIEQRTATVVEHEGRVVGYATVLGFFGHAVGETNEALKALIGSASTFAGPGFLLPTRNAELLRWCLDRGMRVVQPMTLMSMGLYNEPSGAFLPSILY